MDDLEKDPRLKLKTCVMQHNFVWGVVHQAALARNGELNLDIKDRQVHAGMKAAFDELWARADEENLNVVFAIQPERGSGLSGVVETCLSRLLHTPSAPSDNGSYILIYDANNPAAQGFHGSERRVGSPELLADLAETFLQTAEKPPEH